MNGLTIEKVRITAPLIHNITNYVTVNDCANVLIAAGASPIMSDSVDEVEEICSLCNGLNINIGTLNEQTIQAMLKAGKRAKHMSHPVVLDPVGAGASRLRTTCAIGIINDIHPEVIRGNLSEIRALAGVSALTKGVDASELDMICDETLDSVCDFASEYAEKTGAVVAITGATDVISDGARTECIKRGHPMMARITGSGCMLSALCAAFAVAGDDIFDAVCDAVFMMDECGEKAFSRMLPGDGNASFRGYLIDAVYNYRRAD